ncbi:MAG TPA: 3'-5' exonuclease [Ktedonobacteraceae bacterium]|jgi:inhibitor of KinA sporulation pathway (predicted exonuclease)
MAKKLLDQVLVIDVEATCWEGPAPEGQESEIIEIGLCMLEIASGQRLEKCSLLVKPTRSEVSPFCTQLTTLTPEQVAQGISFAEACAILQTSYLAKERVWASYGEYDRQIFEQQCHSQGVAYPFGTRHLNMKTLFALQHALPREVGLAAALRILNLPLEGIHHRGDDDAWNSALILSLLLRPQAS